MITYLDVEQSLIRINSIIPSPEMRRLKHNQPPRFLPQKSLTIKLADTAVAERLCWIGRLDGLEGGVGCFVPGRAGGLGCFEVAVVAAFVWCFLICGHCVWW